MAGPHNLLPYGITPGDNADKIIAKIANGLGVPNGDPSVMQAYTELVVAEHQREEADKDAHNNQIFNDALKYGRSVTDSSITIGDDTYRRIIEFVPGTSGKLDDITARIS